MDPDNKASLVMDIKETVKEYDLERAVDKAKELIILIDGIRCIIVDQPTGSTKYVPIPGKTTPALCDMCGKIYRDPYDYMAHYDGCKLKFIRESQRRPDNDQ